MYSIADIGKLKKQIDWLRNQIKCLILSNTTNLESIKVILGKLNTKEDSFTKNEAFNKDFGVLEDTVAEGNHTHNLSELDNDEGFITGISNITQIPNRSYNDLQDKPKSQKIGSSEDIENGWLIVNDDNHSLVFNNYYFDVIYSESQDAVYVRLKVDELKTDITSTLTTTATTLTFQRNSIHGTKDIPLSSASFDLTDSVVGNVVQVWFKGNSLPTATDLYWTDGVDEDFEALTLYLLTFNLHPDNVIVGTINTI